MRKSERLNDLLLYLSSKNTFHLKDLMERYGISRSSAIRDIRSLEQIGMPIYSQPGRNGAYKLLPNRLLSPIIFTVDEVYSLYFSMLTLQAYQSTPFHLNINGLKSKFESCLSQVHISALHKMEQVFRLGTVYHPNESPYLKEILCSAMEEQPCQIEYKKHGLKKYIVQFFDISSAYGQWYGTAYNFEMQKTQVFRCDKIQSFSPSTQFKGKKLSAFQKPAEELYKEKDAVEFEVQISEKALDLFYKEHYPSMQLCTEENQHFIRGFYNHGEEKFIADYFIRFSFSILSVKPAALKENISKRLNELASYYLDGGFPSGGRSGDAGMLQ